MFGVIFSNGSETYVMKTFLSGFLLEQNEMCLHHPLRAVSKSDKVRAPRQNKETSSLGRAVLSVSSACLRCTHGCTDSQAGSGVTRIICNWWFLSKCMSVYFWWTLKVMIPSESVSQSETLCLCAGGNGGKLWQLVCFKKPRLSRELCVTVTATPPTADRVFVFGLPVSLLPHRLSLFCYSPSHCYHDAHHSFKKTSDLLKQRHIQK